MENPVRTAVFPIGLIRRGIYLLNPAVVFKTKPPGPLRNAERYNADKHQEKRAPLATARL